MNAEESMMILEEWKGELIMNIFYLHTIFKNKDKILNIQNNGIITRKIFNHLLDI